MTPEEARKIIEQFRDREGNSRDDIEAFEIAIKVLEQQPSEECISRQEVLISDDYRTETRWTRRKIEILPFVTPKQKEGKWMPHIVSDKYESIDHDVCSECQTCFYGERTWDWKFCPNRGTKMEGGDDE